MVRIHHGPATVFGDESQVTPLGVASWEGLGSRMNRQSGDLPMRTSRYDLR